MARRRARSTQGGPRRPKMGAETAQEGPESQKSTPGGPQESPQGSPIRSPGPRSLFNVLLQLLLTALRRRRRRRPPRSSSSSPSLSSSSSLCLSSSSLSSCSSSLSFPCLYVLLRSPSSFPLPPPLPNLRSFLFVVVAPGRRPSRAASRAPAGAPADPEGLALGGGASPSGPGPRRGQTF